MVWYCADKRCPPKTRACYGHRDTTGKPRGDKMCFAHKTPTMISLNATHCKYAGCRRSPSYGCVSESTKGQRIFCSEHGKGQRGMSNVKDKSCAEPECKTLANYGFGKSTYCGYHKKKGMSKRAASAAASVMRGPVVSSPESAATVVDTSPASVTVREGDSVGELGQRPASAATGSVQDSVVNTTATTAARGECESEGGRKPPEPRNKSVAVAVKAFAAVAHTSDRDSLVNTTARDKGEGGGGGQPSESVVNTAAATAGAAAAAAGEVGRGEREDTSPALVASPPVGEGEEGDGGGEGDERDEVRKTVAHVVEVTVQEGLAARVEGEGQGEPTESAVNTAAAAAGVQGEAAAEAEAAAGVQGERGGAAAAASATAGEVGREERALVIDAFAAPATAAPPAPAPAPTQAVPQGAEGSSGTGAAASGGGSGGGSGSGGVHEHEEYAVPVTEADSNDDGAAALTPGQKTDPEQPVPTSGERGTVEVGAREEGCTAPATATTGEKGRQTTPPQGGGCIPSSGGGGGSGGGESGTAIDAAILVSAAGAAGAGGVDMASSSNLNLLATVCLLEGNGSCGGIESGGGGDGANRDETVPIEDGALDLSQELAATRVTSTQPDEPVAAPASAQDTECEQPSPASDALVAGGVAVQAAGEAGADDVMPTSRGSAGVAIQPGEAQRVQNSRGSHDLLDEIRADEDGEEQERAVSDKLVASGSSSSGGGGSGSSSDVESRSGNGSENGGGAHHEEDDISVPRRSNRVPGSSALERTSVVRLLDQIRADDPRVEILKLHDYLPADVSTPIINAVLKALMCNSNCQALYIQNVSIGFRDEQLRMLAKVLRRGNIWCLNAGENSGITPSAWWWFVEEIKTTSVTHAYLSEECIPCGLTETMQKAIRANRAKHTRHKSASNVEVIRRCTNMWWNPIHSSKLQAELKAAAAAAKGSQDQASRQASAVARGGGCISSSSSCSSSSSSSSGGGGGSEGVESGTSSGSEAARAAALQAAAGKTSGGGSAGASSTAAKGKGERNRNAGQREQTDARGGRNKRRRSGGAGRNAATASAAECDSKKACGTGRAEKMPDEPKSRQEVWDAGFDDDEAAMDFDDACYESDVDAREELAQEEKKEREAWERERKGEREKERQKQTSKTFHRIKTPSEKEGERLHEAPVQVFPGDTIPVDYIRSWGAKFGFHDKSRCGYCNAGTELKTTEEQKTERTDLELLVRNKRAEGEGGGDGGE